MANSVFKSCNMCEQTWKDVTEFLDDSKLELIGYQANFENIMAGFFLFNHQCDSTLAVPVDAFSHLRTGPFFNENKAGKKGCPDHCSNESNLSPCFNDCECRWVRDVMQKIKAWDKSEIQNALDNRSRTRLDSKLCR